MAHHIIGFVKGDHAVDGAPAVDSNARMTALLGVCLLVAFGIESVTVIDVRQMFTWHVFVGLFIVPLVCFKLATTGYRFWHYYRGAEAYRTKGPPHPILRISAPLLIVATLLMLGAGIAMLAVGPQNSDTWLTIHQGSVIAWAVLISIHVLGHAFETWRLTAADVRAKPPLPRRSLRLIFVAVSLAIGVTVGVASLGWTSAWRNRPRHDDGLAPVTALIAR